MREGYPNLKARDPKFNREQVKAIRRDYVELTEIGTYNSGIVYSKPPSYKTLVNKHGSDIWTIRHVIQGLGAYNYKSYE